MKSILALALTLLLVFATSLSVQAQQTAVTKPVGYHTITIVGNTAFPVFNYIGTNFVQKILASGIIDTPESANTITDDQADFVTAFAGQSNLFVEITSGTEAGANTTISSFTATTLTTDDDLSAMSNPGDTYVVRASMTIGQIFGVANEAGFKPGTAATADIIWVPTGAGFDQYYYNNLTIDPDGPGGNPPILSEGWKKAGQGNTDFSGDPIYFTDAVFVERKATTDPDIDIVITGHVKTTGSTVMILNGFNYLDRTFPVGATLDDTKLYDATQTETLKPGTAATADIVWMQTDDKTGYEQFYYNNLTIDPDGPGGNPPILSEGWKKAGEGNAEFGSTELKPGIIIERKDTAFNLKIQAPPLYQNL